ncbi:hypothetical protein ACHQM5_005046 [Ranunculus cassubicifolius]
MEYSFYTKDEGLAYPEVMDALERSIQERYMRQDNLDYDEETNDVEQQALLPSVRDPKLWMVKCAIGHEREAAVCLMQKAIDRGPELQIRSVVALDHLKNYIYVEADKEAHVKEFSVESKAVDISRDTWVRMKLGIYKGDLASVVDVDNVRQKVTVKLVPRIDLQALANKLEGRDVAKKKATPPRRLMNIEEARDMHIRVERRRDPSTGDYYENVGGMMFKDGFLFKTVAMKSISTQNIQPTFDEIEKFRKPEDGDGDISSFSSLFANRKKGHFMKGDAVIVVHGDLKNLMGWVEKVEDGNVHIRPKMKDLPKTLPVNEKDLCKYFKPGATGMVVKVEGHVLILVSDTTKEDIRVFADHVVESSEVTNGVTKIGDYELHDLVLLENGFGVIIRVESEAFQVLKGNTERPEVAVVKLREIRTKLDRKNSAQDRGKQGPVEHIYRSVLFINDRHHLEHAGYICAKAQSCVVQGGSHSNGDRNGDSMSRFPLRQASQIPPSPRRPVDHPEEDIQMIVPGGRGRGRNGGRGGHDPLFSTTVKIRAGPFKGYRGVAKDVTGTSVRVELESQMKVLTDKISDNMTVSTPYWETSRYGQGNKSPIHPSKSPLHPYMTPLRDLGATPIHDGMRTPMRDKAWNPSAPMSPARWKPGLWGSSPQYQPRTPPSRPYEAPTPGSGWNNTPGGNYNDVATPRDSSPAYASAPSPYIPSTPGGQPMTPDSGGLDMQSPAIGGDGEVPWFLPDILVNVRRSGDDAVGIVRDVLPVGFCYINCLPTLLSKIAPASSGDMIGNI